MTLSGRGRVWFLHNKYTAGFYPLGNQWGNLSTCRLKMKITATAAAAYDWGMARAVYKLVSESHGCKESSYGTTFARSCASTVQEMTLVQIGFLIWERKFFSHQFQGNNSRIFLFPSNIATWVSYQPASYYVVGVRVLNNTGALCNQDRICLL